MSSAPEPVVGIDLGTTFSVVSYLDPQGRPVTIANSEGDLTTPSVVFLDASGAVVGKEAIKSAEFEPDRVAPYPKRDMGGELYHRAVRGAYYRPEVLQALVLRKLKQDAELRLGPVTKCVITVPAYFNEPRRKATQDAGRMAGWEVLDIINEPTSAAIAYGVHRGFLSPTGPETPPETILVYDLGGGTFDVTLMHVERNCFTTLATAGDVELGGIDWDNRIVDLLAERFLAEHGVDPRTDAATLYRLKREAEDVKRSLSTKTDANVLFAYDGKRLRTTVTRAEFENRTGDLVDRTIMTIRKLLREAKRTYLEISRLLVVGGSSRMPMIREALEKETGFTVDHPLSVDEAVAHGAALYARYLQEKAATGTGGFAVRNVNSHTLGVLGIEPSTMMRRRKIMIARNTPLPAQHTQRFVTAAAGQKSVVVTVIEGGDDSGNHSTLIGRCILDGLAPNLPPRSQVDVTFVYSDNGRLEVRAFMPAVERDSVLTIERAKGMSPELLHAWAECLATGLPDGTGLPENKQPTTTETPPPANSAATANPMHAPELKRMPKQIDVVEMTSTPEPPKEIVLEAVAEVVAEKSPSNAAAPSAATTPASKPKPPEAKPPEKKSAPTTPTTAPSTEKTNVAAAASTKPAATSTQPAPAPAPSKSSPSTAASKPASEFDFAEPVHDVSNDVGAFAVDPNKKRKKKKKPPEGEASAAPTAEAPKKKPGWKFW